MSRDVSKGDVPALILAVLCDGPCHGYAIAREVERRSQQVFRLREGSLYPALRVLEQDGFIEGRWEEPESGPARKTYVITANGRIELARRAAAWKAYVQAFTALIGSEPDEQTA